MFSNTWFVILTLCCLSWLSWAFITNRKRVHSPLPPGPRGLPVVGSLPFLGPELHTYFTSLAQTYGPIISLRLGKKIVVVVSSPSTAKEILKDHDIIFVNRDVPAAARVATYGGTDVAWSPYGQEWRMLRKVCARELLGSATLDAVYGLRKHEIHKTMLYFKQHSGTAVNIGDQMFLTAMNMVTNMMWGGTVKGDERAKLGADFRAVVSEITNQMGAPNVSDFFPGLERFDLQGIVKSAKESAKRLDDMFEDVIDRRRKMDKHQIEENKDLLQVLLELKDNSVDSKTPFTMVHLKCLLLVRIFYITFYQVGDIGDPR